MADNYKTLWLIPGFCLFTIGMGLAKQSQQLVGIVTGALPFFALAYWLHQIGPDLMKMLGIGAYCELGLGVVLIVLSFRGK